MVSCYFPLEILAVVSDNVGVRKDRTDFGKNGARVMGTYDGWLSLKGREKFGSRSFVREWLEENDHIIGVYGITTTDDGEKYLAFRGKPNELEDTDLWREVSDGSIIWALDDGSGDFKDWVNEKFGLNIEPFEDMSPDGHWRKELLAAIDRTTEYWDEPGNGER